MVIPMVNSPVMINANAKIKNSIQRKKKQAGEQVDDGMSNDLQILRGTQLSSRDRKNQSKAILAKGAELNHP